MGCFEPCGSRTPFLLCKADEMLVGPWAEPDEDVLAIRTTHLGP